MNLLDELDQLSDNDMEIEALKPIESENEITKLYFSTKLISNDKDFLSLLKKLEKDKSIPQSLTLKEQEL